MKEFWNKIKDTIGEKAVALLLAKFVTRENILKLANSILEQLEELAQKTDTKLDDQIIKKIKDVLDPGIKPQ